MISGFKKDSTGKSGKKGKLVLAKDPKQAALAVLVMVVFIGFTIYNISKYYQEQNPPPQPAQTQMQPANQEAGQNGAQNPQNPQTPPDPNNPNATQNGANQPPQDYSAPPAPAANTFNPILPIILVLLVLGGILAFVFRKKLSGLLSGSAQGQTGKDPGKKEKFQLAKNPKEAAAAIIIMCIFVGNGIYMIVKHVQEQMYEAALRQKNVSQETENNIARQQQNNLKDLSTNSANNPSNQDIAQDSNDIYSQTLNLKDQNGNAVTKLPPNAQVGPNGGGKTSEEGVEIMSKKALSTKSGKMVLISVADSGRANPFLPEAEAGLSSYSSSKLPFLPAPPEFLSTGSEAGKVMTTVISGILYDKYSPSAIINIEGTDYLVKKGDIINRYKVLAISKDEVIVQLGNNVYKAGVGQLLSKTDINYNTIANLNKKFGGNDVHINVKKKGY